MGREAFSKFRFRLRSKKFGNRCLRILEKSAQTQSMHVKMTVQGVKIIVRSEETIAKFISAMR